MNARDLNGGNVVSQDENFRKYNNNSLPNYSVATDLPTYEEAERSKLLEENRRPEIVEGNMLLNGEGSGADMAFEAEVGNDGSFLVCFLSEILFDVLNILDFCFC